VLQRQEKDSNRHGFRREATGGDEVRNSRPSGGRNRADWRGGNWTKSLVVRKVFKTRRKNKARLWVQTIKERGRATEARRSANTCGGLNKKKKDSKKP